MTKKHDDMPREIWAIIDPDWWYENVEHLAEDGYDRHSKLTHYTRTDTIPKQEGLDPDTLYFCTLCMTNRKGDKNCRCHKTPEPVKETQKPLDVEGLKSHALKTLGNKADDYCKGFEAGYNQAIDNLNSQGFLRTPEPVKETQNPLHVEKTCKENAEILADKDRVMNMMAEALKQIVSYDIQWTYGLDENCENIKPIAKQALAEYERLKNDRM